MGRLIFAIILSACGQADLQPFSLVDPPPELVDLHVEGLGFEEFEGALMWVEVFDAAAPPQPVEVFGGTFFTRYPSAYEPWGQETLHVSIFVDFGHDGSCDPGDQIIDGAALVLTEDDPTIVLMDFGDPSVFVEPCLPDF